MPRTARTHEVNSQNLTTTTTTQKESEKAYFVRRAVCSSLLDAFGLEMRLLEVASQIGDRRGTKDTQLALRFAALTAAVLRKVSCQIATRAEGERTAPAEVWEEADGGGLSAGCALHVDLSGREEEKDAGRLGSGVEGRVCAGWMLARDARSSLSREGERPTSEDEEGF